MGWGCGDGVCGWGCVDGVVWMWRGSEMMALVGFNSDCYPKISKKSKIQTHPISKPKTPKPTIQKCKS
jgi:hypothetical protein